MELTAAWAQSVPTRPLPDTALPCPCTCPEEMPRPCMDLAKLGLTNCFGCHFSCCKITKESPWVIASVCWCSGKGWCRVLLFQPLKCKEPNATKKFSPVPLLHQVKGSYHGEGRAEGAYTVGRVGGSPGMSVVLLSWASSWGWT